MTSKTPVIRVTGDRKFVGNDQTDKSGILKTYLGLTFLKILISFLFKSPQILLSDVESQLKDTQ